MRLQKQIAFSGLTVELFEDLDEGPDPHEPDVASFSQLLVCSAAAERASDPAGPGDEALHDVGEDEAFALVQPPRARAGGGACTAGGAGAAARPGAGAEGEGVGLAHGPAEDPARDRPDGASETDGWDDDMSPFELLPGMPGCQAVAGDPSPGPALNPLNDQRPPPAARAGATGELGQPSGRSPVASDAGGSGADGDGRHVVICSAEGVGCSGELRLLLTWRAPAQVHPCVHAELTLEPLQVRAPVPQACRSQVHRVQHTCVHSKAGLLWAGQHGSGLHACCTHAMRRRPLVVICVK